MFSGILDYFRIKSCFPKIEARRAFLSNIFFFFLVLTENAEPKRLYRCRIYRLLRTITFAVSHIYASPHRVYPVPEEPPHKAITRLAWEQRANTVHVLPSFRDGGETVQDYANVSSSTKPSMQRTPPTAESPETSMLTQSRTAVAVPVRPTGRHKQFARVIGGTDNSRTRERSCERIPVLCLHAAHSI